MFHKTLSIRLITNLLLAVVLIPSFSTTVLAAPTESTIEGEIVKVVPEEKEIYVSAEGKKHEYYFNDKTTVTKADENLSYDALKVGQKVRVTAMKIGKRLDPVKVEILNPTS